MALLAACTGGGNDAAPAAETGTTASAGPTATGPVDTTAVETTASAVNDVLPTIELDPLPAPAPSTASDPDAVSVELAGRVLVGDLGAAVAALPLAGFPIADGDQLVSTGFTGDGVPVAPWQAWAWTLQSGHGGMPLADLAEAVSAITGGGVEPDVVAEALLGELRAGAESAAPTTRFLARFVAALSGPATAADLLDPATTPDAVVLDPFAAQLVGHIVIARLLERGATTEPENTVVGSGLLSPASAARLAGGRGPCHLEDPENLAVTIAEETIVRLVKQTSLGPWSLPGFEGLLPYLESKGLGGIATYRKGIEAAGLLLDFISFAQAFAALRFDVTIDGAGPLVRTKEARPVVGERRHLSATVSYDVGEEQFANCLRVVYAQLGVTFNLKQDGPVAGAGINWVGLDGFVSRSDVSGRTVEFYGGDPSLGLTDTAGVATIGIEGFGQPTKVADPAVVVDTSFSVKVLIQLKTAAFWSDLFDALKTTGGALDAIRIPLELLQRTRWLGTAPVRFPLTDWAAGFAFDPLTFQVDYVGDFGPIDDVFTASGYVCGDPATTPWTIDSHVDHLYDGTVEEGRFTLVTGEHLYDEDPSNYVVLDVLDGDPDEVQIDFHWLSNGIAVVGPNIQRSPAIPLATCPPG